MTLCKRESGRHLGKIEVGKGKGRNQKKKKKSAL